MNKWSFKLTHNNKNGMDEADTVMRAIKPSTQEISNLLGTFENDLRQLEIPYYVVSAVHRDIPIYGYTVQIYANWPREMLDIWEEKRGFTLDPIVQYARTASKPFFWRDAMKNTSKHSTHLFGIANSFGLKEGHVVPLHDKLGGRRGGASIGGQVFPYKGEELVSITKLCTDFFEDIDSLINDTPLTLPKLSKQEREVLVCAARGESIQDTSQILQISESAVKDAQSRARRKLKAKNTTHACIIAAQIKLI